MPIVDPMRNGNLNLIDNENYILIKSYRKSEGCLTQTARYMGLTVSQVRRLKERAQSKYGKLLIEIEQL